MIPQVKMYEGDVFRQHCRSRGRSCRDESLWILDGQRLAATRATAFGDSADQTGLRDQHLGVEQAQAGRQYLVTTGYSCALPAAWYPHVTTASTVLDELRSIIATTS